MAAVNRNLTEQPEWIAKIVETNIELPQIGRKCRRPARPVPQEALVALLGPRGPGKVTTSRGSARPRSVRRAPLTDAGDVPRVTQFDAGAVASLRSVVGLPLPGAAVGVIRSHTQGRGIWVIDRSGDRKKLREAPLERTGRFVIRSTGKRSVTDRRNLCGTVAEVAGRCRNALPGASQPARDRTSPPLRAFEAGHRRAD